MPERHAQAEWKGSLKEGSGELKLGSGAFRGAYSFSSRFEQGSGTNPEELIAAAHAGCFSMALSAALGKAGFSPESIQTRANVKLEKGDSGFSITEIRLVTEGKVPNIDEGTFLEHAQGAKNNCPVSKVLGGTKIELEAKLVQ